MRISDNEIHVWCTNDEAIQDPILLSQYHNFLNDEEIKQQKRFYFEKHRHQYLITRAMVRSILSQYVKNISPEKWMFEKNEYGRPSISNPLAQKINFNISHTEKLIVIAVTKSGDIGIDVEYIPRLRKFLDIANRFFSPAELRQLIELPIEKQNNRFIDLWTLKEAYIKACGMGLSISLDHFSYIISEQGQISIEFNPARRDQADCWQFWQMQPSQTHKISMAFKSEQAQNKDFDVTIREIIPLSSITMVNYPISSGSIITE